MKKRHILLIEGNEAIKRQLDFFLPQISEITLSSTIQSGIKLLFQAQFDLVAIHVTTGFDQAMFDLLTEAQQEANFLLLFYPIQEAHTRTCLLELGADYCLPAPFDTRECSAAISSLLRRVAFDGNTQIKANCIKHKELYLYPDQLDVTMRGKLVDLTRIERNLLFFLVANQGKICYTEELCSALWPVEDNAEPSRLAYHINRLRYKLGISPRDVDYIKNLPGVGYIFAPNVEF